MLASEAMDDVTVSAPQLGKTIVLALWCLIGAYRDAQAGINLPTWWAAPTYGQVDQGMGKLITLARSVGLWRGDRSAPYPRLTLSNGGVIEARSWQDPDNLFGPTVARIAVDEFGFLTPEARAALNSRVAETRVHGLGFMRYAGNVGEIGGEAEAIWQHASSGQPGWAARTWTWRDRMLAAPCSCGINGQGTEIKHSHLHESTCQRGRYLAHLRDLQATMSEAHFRQLYGAEWVDWSALPVYSFERAVHVTDDADLDPHLQLGVSFDFNVDPMAVTIGQHLGKEIWTSDEVCIPGGATTEAACAEVIRRYPGWRAGVAVYGDASGKARKTSASATDYDIILARFRAAYGASSVQFNVPGANPTQADRVNAVNAKIRAADGSVHYRVHRRCVNLAKDRARVSWKPGTREIDKRDKSLTHFSDSDDYRIVWEFPIVTASVAAVGVTVPFSTSNRPTIMDMET